MSPNRAPRAVLTSAPLVLLVTLAACGGTDHLRAVDLPEDVIGKSVEVNGQALTAEELDAIFDRYGVAVRDGRYWYDARSGLFGADGAPPVGVFVAGLDLGGPLAVDASRGNTNVFVNGRRLRQEEVDFLIGIFGVVYEGRYWLEANGDAGVEGDPTVLFNLWAAVRERQNSGGGNGGYGASGDNYYGNISTGTYANSEGGCSYVMVDGASVTSGCG